MDLDGWEFVPHDFNMNPFTNPSPKTPPKFVESTTEESRSNPNQIVPVPIQAVEKNPDDELAKAIESPKVFFKRGNEFVDTKTESTETESKNCSSKSLESSGKEKDSWNLPKGIFGGIRAVCSFGVVAATVCIIILGNGRKQSHHKLRIQIYADDDNKRIKKAVKNTKRLNEAISAARGIGAPFSRAQITVGGHYDAL